MPFAATLSLALTTHALRRCSTALRPLTSQIVNVELLGPRVLGHIEHSCPGVGPLPVSSCLPALLVEISSRGSANPGTGVGRHPTSEEHLDSPRGPGLGRPRNGSTSPSPRDPPAASSSRPYALSDAADPTLRLHSRWGGPTPATPRCSPPRGLGGRWTLARDRLRGKSAQYGRVPGGPIAPHSRFDS